MGDKDLLTLFYNASSLISEGRMMEESANVLVAIQKEGAKRLELAKQNEYKADPPDDGMLKALGCKVGKDQAPTRIPVEVSQDPCELLRSRHACRRKPLPLLR